MKMEKEEILNSKSNFSIVSNPLFQSTFEFWSKFDLDSKRVSLDSQGLEMQSSKEKSLKSRKKLAEETKSFRKLNDPEKLDRIGNLLKSYQEEIDKLTRRAKYSESCFLSFYKSLYTAPDPVGVLDLVSTLISKLNDLEEQNKKYMMEIKEYEDEFLNLKNQDITIRNLETKILQFEQNLENQIQEQVNQRSLHIHSETQLQIQTVLEQKQQLDKEMEDSRSTLLETQTKMSNMQVELNTLRKKHEEGYAAHYAVMEVISQDKDLKTSLQYENMELKKKIEKLKSQLLNDQEILSTATNTTTSSSSSLSSSSSKATTTTTITSLKQKNFDLLHQMETLKYQYDEIEKEKQKEILKCQSENEKLVNELNQRPTKEQMKKLEEKLHILEQLEFNVLDHDEHSDENVDENEKEENEDKNNKNKNNMEHILLLKRKIRKLQHETHKKQVTLDQLQLSFNEVKDDLQKKIIIIEEQNCLIHRLEDDIAKGEEQYHHQYNVNNNPNNRMVMNNQQHQQDTKTNKYSTLHSNTQILSQVLSTSTLPSEQDPSESKSMLEIVKGQRDRFRERIKELESDQEKQLIKINHMKISMQHLETDNLQLFETIRYLRSFKNHGNAHSMKGERHMNSPTSHGNQHLMEEGQSNGIIENKYKQMYDEKMNPFTQFYQSEQQKRYTSLSAAEKITLMSTQMFLSNKFMRNFAFFYIVMLHVLVMATLYSYTTFQCDN